MNDYVSTVAMHQDTWGTFLTPDPGLADVEDLHEALGMRIRGGHRADLKLFAGRNAVFDRIIARIESLDLAYEDLCSAHHYFDLFGRVEHCHGQLTRLVDLGVYMGGSSMILAGCVEPMGLELDLVDVNAAYLKFTHERLRRAFPRAMNRVRMFHGDLPTYAARVLDSDPGARTLVHHDGSHTFEQVVRDLSALYFVRDRVHSLAIKATHLRGNIAHLNFVDAAVYAVFGAAVEHTPIGARFPKDAPVTVPNRWDGKYFLAGHPEGMHIPFDAVEWKYPHPTMELDDFLPVQAPERASASGSSAVG